MASSSIKVESGIQLLARLTKKPNIEKFYPILFNNGPKHNDFIEVYSEGSTNCLLVELICEALIPQELNGPGAGVIVLSTDGNLDFNLITYLLRNKITKNISHSHDKVEALLSSILNKLYILEIFDATQFYVTIQNLENILTRHPHISLAVFHTLTAFYWSEQNYKQIKMDLYIKRVLSTIQKVIKDHKITILYSTIKETTDLELYGQLSIAEQLIYRINIEYNTNNIHYIKVRTSEGLLQKEFNLAKDEITFL